MSIEARILEEINRISERASYSGRDSAREFYYSGKLPSLIKEHFFEREKVTRAEASRLLGMSTDSLRRVLTEGQISENMLFRIQSFFLRSAKSDSDWVLITSTGAQSLVNRLSTSLQELYELARASNSLDAENGGVSPIQKA